MRFAAVEVAHTQPERVSHSLFLHFAAYTLQGEVVSYCWWLKSLKP